MLNKNIQKKQIKQSFDNLPTGIIFAKTNGIILLANKLMYELYEKITGQTLQSAYAFWNCLKINNANIKLIEDGNMPSLMFDNKKIYNFSKKTILVNSNNILQIDAVDITKLYNIRLDLAKKNKKIIEIRNKMFETQNTIEKITFNEEVIDAKMKIHNSMGTGLARIRHYLMTGQGDIEKSLNTWAQSIELLNKNEKIVRTNEFDSLMNACKSIGIDIHINGTWPTDRKIARVLIWVSRECLINAFMHANAKNMFITINSDDYEYTITFKNDGKPPKEKIKNGGGFNSIKKVVSEIDGNFDFSTKDEFLLILHLPK